MVLAPGHQEGGLEEGRLRLSFGHLGPPYCRINPEPSDQWGDAWRPLGSPGIFPIAISGKEDLLLSYPRLPGAIGLDLNPGLRLE
jgi:hypothetical protein